MTSIIKPLVMTYAWSLFCFLSFSVVPGTAIAQPDSLLQCPSGWHHVRSDDSVVTLCVPNGFHSGKSPFSSSTRWYVWRRNTLTEGLTSLTLVVTFAKADTVAWVMPTKPRPDSVSTCYDCEWYDSVRTTDTVVQGQKVHIQVGRLNRGGAIEFNAEWSIDSVRTVSLILISHSMRTIDSLRQIIPSIRVERICPQAQLFPLPPVCPPAPTPSSSLPRNLPRSEDHTGATYPHWTAARSKTISARPA